MMSRQEMKWIVRSLWIVSIVLVCYLSVIPRLEIPYRFSGSDKVWHGISYAWLALLPFFGFERRGAALAGAITMVPLGIGLEFLQQHVPGRHLSLGDMIADTFGVALGILAARYLMTRYGLGHLGHDQRKIRP